VAVLQAGLVATVNFVQGKAVALAPAAEPVAGGDRVPSSAAETASPWAEQEAVALVAGACPVLQESAAASVAAQPHHPARIPAAPVAAAREAGLTMRGRPSVGPAEMPR
jgi:hypothetical protein